MNISIRNIFTATYKFLTVKWIILMIEFCVFTPKRIKGFIKPFLVRSIKLSLDDSTHMNHMIYIWIFEYILSNKSNYTWHPTSVSKISIYMFFSSNPQLLYIQTYIFYIFSIIIWWWIFFITSFIRHVTYIGWQWYVCE